MRAAWAIRRPTLLAAPLAVPPLSLTELALLTAASLPAVALPAAASPLPSFSSLRSVTALLLCAVRGVVCFCVLRLARRLQKHRSQLVASEEQVAVEGSRFARVFPGIVLHYLLAPASQPGPSDPPPLLMHFNHGFGANALTFDPLFESLGSALAKRSPRTAVWFAAHDRVGFGLTSRPREMIKYADEPAAAHGLRLLDMVEPLVTGPPPSPTQVGAEPQEPPPPGARAGRSRPPTVLVGHSLGGALSARMAVQLASADGDAHIKALVLIAPALITLGAAPAADPAAGAAEAARAPSALRASCGRVLHVAGWPVRVLSRPVRRLGMWTCVSGVRLAVQCMIHSGRFWQRGLGMAYSSGGVPRDEMVARYRWAARVRDADRGVACFTLAQLGAAVGGAGRARGGAAATRPRDQGNEPQEDFEEGLMANRPSDATVVDELRRRGVPVLIIHGADDAIVPPSNSRRLADRLGCRLVELPQCGHCPQEERPELVTSAILEFVQREASELLK